MCGIIGYIGSGEKKEILLNGLRELEYRGYDSAGISILKDGKIETFKSVGKIINLENKCKDYHSYGFGVGIGHTRWATHGKAIDINAHPHYGEFSNIIHNGIIENYHAIKKDLEASGYKFISQTDTEVIVHLFEYNYKNSKDSNIAFKQTVEALKGSYAILLITKLNEGSIFYAKNGSPLLIATNTSGEIYFASSSAPLIGLVDEVCYLDDGEFGCMDKDGFYNLKNIRKMNITKSFAQKDGFRFFMEKEIYEQACVLEDTLMGRILDDRIFFDEIPSGFLDGIYSITICACGTSYNAALSAKYLFEREAKIKTNVVIASEFRYAQPILNNDELFIIISQSGETADTLEALKFAKKNTLKTLAICNVEDSSIVREADVSLLTRAGIEKGVASTKAFATQVMLLWVLCVYFGQERKSLNKNMIQYHIHNMQKAIKAVKVTLNLHDRIRKIAKRYLHGHGFFFIGRDVFYPLALEGALKLKEISYLHAEGYPAGEMKHGPIALADSNLFTISLISKHLLFDKIKSNTEELSARDATICIVSQENLEIADDTILLNKFDSYMEEYFAMMVVMQILALEVAVRLENDVDMPRNLAKSVTVE